MAHQFELRKLKHHRRNWWISFYVFDTVPSHPSDVPFVCVCVSRFIRPFRFVSRLDYLRTLWFPNMIFTFRSHWRRFDLVCAQFRAESENKRQQKHTHTHARWPGFIVSFLHLFSAFSDSLSLPLCDVRLPFGLISCLSGFYFSSSQPHCLLPGTSSSASVCVCAWNPRSLCSLARRRLLELRKWKKKDIYNTKFHL